MIRAWIYYESAGLTQRLLPCQALPHSRTLLLALSLVKAPRQATLSLSVLFNHQFPLFAALGQCRNGSSMSAPSVCFQAMTKRRFTKKHAVWITVPVDAVTLYTGKHSNHWSALRSPFQICKRCVTTHSTSPSSADMALSPQHPSRTLLFVRSRRRMHSRPLV